MKLSPNDTSALRLAISRDDNLIRNALESYRLSLNEAALVASLYQVIQKTTVDIQQSDNDVFVPDEDSDTELMDSPRKMDSPRLNPDALPTSFNNDRIVTAPVVPSPKNATPSSNSNGSAKNRFTFNNSSTGVNTASSASAGATTATSVTAAMTNGIHSDSKNNTYETEDEDASTENEDDQYTQDAADYELQDDDDDDDYQEDDDDDEEEEEEDDELNTTANTAGKTVIMPCHEMMNSLYE